MLPNSVSYCRAKPLKVLAAAPRPRKRVGSWLRSQIGPLARRGIPGCLMFCQSNVNSKCLFSWDLPRNRMGWMGLRCPARTADCRWYDAHALRTAVRVKSTGDDPAPASSWRAQLQKSSRADLQF